MAAWYSSKAFPTPSQSPPSHPLDPSLCSQQKPSPRDCSIIPKLQLITAAPSRGPASLSGVCMAEARTVWFSFHLGCHRLAVWFSALNVSSLTQAIAPMWESDPCFSHWTPCPTRGRSSSTHTLVLPLVPSAYWVLHDSIYHFPVVRYSWPLSVGVLHALLCLKVYSWCIHGERRTLCPATPLPSCSFLYFFYKVNINITDQNKYYLVLIWFLGKI